MERGDGAEDAALSAARLCALCLHAAVALMLFGLILAQFVGAQRLGMVVALLGVAAYGGYVACCYIEWDEPR